MREIIKESEADLATWVEDLLAQFNFYVAHFRPARVMRNGVETYRTAVSCDGKGYPDYNAVKSPRCLFIELKSETGKVTLEQRRWLDLLSEIEVVETYLIRPSDREEFQEIIMLPHVPNLIERREFKCSWANLRD